MKSYLTKILLIAFAITQACLSDDKTSTVQGTVADRTLYSPDFDPVPGANILYIFADDIGYEALNCFGGLDFKTPHLDKMASEGIRFTRVHTSPVCTPSRVSMHTGKYVPRHGHTGVLPVHTGTAKKVDFETMPTYAQIIRENGYHTVTTGKWQLATLEIWPNHIRNAGFDTWCVWQIWKDNAKTLRHWNPTLNRDGKVLTGIEGNFGPDVLKDYVIEQMREATRIKKPFLIVHNELLPHYPIVDTPADRKAGRKASLGNMVSYLDTIVGDLLAEVDKLGIRNQTYVVFMGDNGTLETDFKNPRAGTAPGERKHTRHTTAGLVNGGKHQMNDAGSHVPMIVWGPKSIPVGAVCDELVDIVDIFPTFCQLTATEIREDIALDGRSIASQIHGNDGLKRDWVHHQLQWNQYRNDGGVNLFDGSFRYHANSGRLIDARNLPAESPAPEGDPEALDTAAKLKALGEKITKTSPPPATTFQ